MSVHTASNLVQLFERITERFGAFDNSRLSQNPDVPIKELRAGFQCIYDEMIAAGCYKGSSRVPESPLALEQQMRWATTSQDVRRMSKAQRKIQRRNRYAAYLGGFMTMNDIIMLESRASRAGCLTPW
jgi:hypothetical protein